MSPITIAYNQRPITEITYEFFVANILPTIHAMAVSFATIPVGHWMLVTLDNVLKIVNETVLWSSQNNTRSVTWLIFMPLLMTVQYFRVLTSLTLFALLGKTLTNDELNKMIENIRSNLDDIIQKGQTIREDELVKLQAQTKTKQMFLLEFINTILGMWPLRPLTDLIKDILSFFGIVQERPGPDWKPTMKSIAKGNHSPSKPKSNQQSPSKSAENKESGSSAQQSSTESSAEAQPTTSGEAQPTTTEHRED